MKGMLITKGGLNAAIVSLDRPLAYFEGMGRLGVDMQPITLPKAPVCRQVFVTTGRDVLLAVVDTGMERP